MNNMNSDEQSNDGQELYHRLGGAPQLRLFVDGLYRYMDSLGEVQHVRDLHAMSLDVAAERLFCFMSGWLGGPPLFQQNFGEPRLRRRHMHISIGDVERDQWLLCAQRSLDDMDWEMTIRDELMQRLREMADHLRNQQPLHSACGDTRQCAS